MAVRTSVGIATAAALTATFAALSLVMSATGTKRPPEEEQKEKRDVTIKKAREMPDGFRQVVDQVGHGAFVSSAASDTVRLEEGPEPVVSGLKSAEDVWKKIEEVKATQSKYRNAELYTRRWEPVDGFGAAAGKSGSGSNKKNTKHSFSVMQFNTLAEGLSSGPSVITAFPIAPAQSAKERGNCFGGFTALKNPEISLDFSLRRWRLIEEIVRPHEKQASSSDTTGSCDLIAMQEVDRFYGFFEPVLAHFGYRGIFETKGGGGPGSRLGWYSDGCALFWKEDVFEIISQKRMSYSVGSQVCIIATLRHLPSGRILVAAVTHLKAKENPENEKVRTTQASELIGYVSDAASVAAQAGDNQDVPIIISGDFNTVPGGDGNTCIKSVITRSSAPHFASSYPIDPISPGFFTTWKTRGEKTVKRVIDYIFYNRDDARGVRCTHTLGIPNEGDMEPEGLPGFRYPSDHFMVAATFDLDE